MFFSLSVYLHAASQDQDQMIAHSF